MKKNCEHSNQSRRARVYCLQNFNVSQQVLSKIVARFACKVELLLILFLMRNYNEKKL